LIVNEFIGVFKAHSDSKFDTIQQDFQHYFYPIMPQSKNRKMPDFEKSLAELEKIVERMERGEQTLDDTLKDFERGMALSEKCQISLDQAQQKVEKLVKKHGAYKLEVMGNEQYDEDADQDDC